MMCCVSGGPGGLRCFIRQQALWRPPVWLRACQLPGLPSPGGGLRSGGHCGNRLWERTSGWGRRMSGALWSCSSKTWRSSGDFRNLADYSEHLMTECLVQTCISCRWQRTTVGSLRSKPLCVFGRDELITKESVHQTELCFMLLTSSILLAQVWLQRGRRFTCVTSGRPGRRSNRPKRTQSSPPFSRISGEGWRWGHNLSFLPVCLMSVSLNSSELMMV